MKKMRFYYPVVLVAIMYFILLNTFFFLIGNENSLLLVRLTYPIISIGISLVISIIYYKKKFQLTFSVNKAKISTYWFFIMLLSIILGVAFNLFDHWPFLFSYVIEEAARLGFGTPEYIEAVYSSPFLMLYIGIIGPILEEFFYRGILFNQCELELGVKRACFFSALIWAVSHGWWGSFLYVFPMGIIISYFYHKTRNILIPILIHGTNNFYSVITEYKINKRILETLFHTSLDDLDLMKANIVIGLIILLASVTIFYFIVQRQQE